MIVMTINVSFRSAKSDFPANTREQWLCCDTAFPHLSPPFPTFHLGSAVATPPFARYDYLPKYIRKQSIARPFAADDASMLAIQAVADAADRAARAALPPPPPPSAAAARRAWGLSYACGVRDCHRHRGSAVATPPFRVRFAACRRALSNDAPRSTVGRGRAAGARRAVGKALPLPCVSTAFRS